jgi:hypothetical protein
LHAFNVAFFGVYCDWLSRSGRVVAKRFTKVLPVFAADNIESLTGKKTAA